MTPEDVAVAIARHDQRILITEKGVSNFREFQTDVREFISEYRAVRKEREEAEKAAAKLATEKETLATTRRKEIRANRIAVVGILSVCLLPPASWLSIKITKYAGDIYQIVQEWESVHKADIPPKHTSEVSTNKDHQIALDQ